MDADLPVVVIGAGPIGLAAAAELVERDLPVVVLERGNRVGTAVTDWGHVRLFSPWRDLVAPAAERLLEKSGWGSPKETVYPTGSEWVDSYLAPLAAALRERVRLQTEVAGVSRLGRDRVVDSGCDEQPFTIWVRTGQGEERFLARAVIDASGTWGSPNPIGGDGLPAAGELGAECVSYRIPDIADPATRARYGGKVTAVVGKGHSALTALVALSSLTESMPGTRALWVLRRDAVGNAFGGETADQLEERGALGLRAKAAVDAGHIDVVTGFRTVEVEHREKGVVLVDDEGRRSGPVDEVVALTGFRPDLRFLSEVRLSLDSTLQAPLGLAPLIDPNTHSCGTVYPHGAAELSHPENDFFLAGMKSYGRAPTFLALTGFEQVRSIAAHLAGDHDAASRVDLLLPGTGVCGGTGLFDDPAAMKTDTEDYCGPSSETGAGSVPGPGRSSDGLSIDDRPVRATDSAGTK